MARTFLVTLHYDGGEFAGWQRQTKGRTVQAEFEAVLERLCDAPVRVHAAGRTDAGVHSLGMGVSCSIPDRWEAPALERALNSLLPPDCWAETVREMQPGFHARTRASGRRYRYVIGTDIPSASPFRRRYEWALGRPVSATAVGAAAHEVLGEHDFSAFSVRSSERPHKRCRIATSHWTERPGGTGLVYDVVGDRFLHHMVRMLVGTMVDIGLERRPLSDMSRLLTLDPALVTSPPAPAQGLFFVAADYPTEWFL